MFPAFAKVLAFEELLIKPKPQESTRTLVPPASKVELRTSSTTATPLCIFKSAYRSRKIERELKIWGLPRKRASEFVQNTKVCGNSIHDTTSDCTIFEGRMKIGRIICLKGCPSTWGTLPIARLFSWWMMNKYCATNFDSHWQTVEAWFALTFQKIRRSEARGKLNCQRRAMFGSLYLCLRWWRQREPTIQRIGLCSLLRQPMCSNSLVKWLSHDAKCRCQTLEWLRLKRKGLTHTTNDLDTNSTGLNDHTLNSETPVPVYLKCVIALNEYHVTYRELLVPKICSGRCEKVIEMEAKKLNWLKESHRTHPKLPPTNVKFAINPPEPFSIALVSVCSNSTRVFGNINPWKCPAVVRFLSLDLARTCSTYLLIVALNHAHINNDIL